MKKIFAFLLIGFLCAGTALAADVNAEWAKLSKALDNDPNISDETKAALKSFSKALIESNKGEELAPGELNDKINEWFNGKKRIEAADKLFGTKTKRGLLERLTLYGDFRYRFQVDSNRDSMAPSASHSHKDRAQQMVRLRIGFELNIEEDLLDFGARLTTGSVDDPRATNATFDDDFAKIDVNYDRIYIRYTPFTESRPYRLFGVADMSTTFYLGKFDHKWLFIGTDVAWDYEVQPTGFGVLNRFRNFDCKYLEEIRFSLGYYQMTEENYNEDAMLFGAQFGLISNVFKYDEHEFQFTYAFGFYNVNDRHDDDGGSSIYNNNNSSSSIGSGTTGSGTSTNFISDFNILQNYFRVDFSGFEILGKKRPIALTVELLYNASANGDPTYTRHSSDDVDLGLTIMLTMGELKKKGDWRIGYFYTALERDSTLPGIALADLTVGNTNCIGSIVWLDYALFDKTSLRLWYGFSTERIDDGSTTSSEDDHTNNRFRFEIRIKF